MVKRRVLWKVRDLVEPEEEEKEGGKRRGRVVRVWRLKAVML